MTSPVYVVNDLPSYHKGKEYEWEYGEVRVCSHCNFQLTTQSCSRYNKKKKSCPCSLPFWPMTFSGLFHSQSDTQLRGRDIFNEKGNKCSVPTGKCFVFRLDHRLFMWVSCMLYAYNPAQEEQNILLSLSLPRVKPLEAVSIKYTY